eukprot:3275115-Pyramimonas_sp.AAC.1
MLGCPGAFLHGVWAILGPILAALGRFVAVLELCWGPPGPFSKALEGLLDYPWAVLGHGGPSWDSLGGSCAVDWP